MNDFCDEIMNTNKTIFSIDRITSDDRRACKVIVLFDDNSVKSKIVKNDYKFRRQYQYLRKRKLGISL